MSQSLQCSYESTCTTIYTTCNMAQGECFVYEKEVFVNWSTHKRAYGISVSIALFDSSKQLMNVVNTWWVAEWSGGCGWHETNT